MGSQSKNQTVTQETNPWVGSQPHLQTGMQQAANLYNQGGRQYYGNNTIADETPEIDMARSMQANRAAFGSPLTAQAQNNMMGTLQGNYLNSNPHLSGAIDTANREVVDNYRNAVAPSIDAASAKSGRYGSNVHARLHNQAQSNLANQLSDNATNLSYQDYGNERARQQQAAMAAPQMAREDYYDIGMLQDVGLQKQQRAQDLINADMGRYNAAQDLPYQNLQDYMNFVNGIGGQYSSSAKNTPIYRNKGAGAIGGALSGATAGASIGGPWGAAIGGGLGLLGGLF